MRLSSSPTHTDDRSTESQLKPAIVLFDLFASGHHPVYIRHLVEGWQRSQRQEILQVVVSPQFMEQHSDIVAQATEQIRFTAVTPAEMETSKQARSFGASRSESRLARSFAEWNLFCRYARQLKATQAMLLHLDSLQIPLWLGQKPPCPVSGIYFRPTFHYGSLLHNSMGWKDRVRQWRQKFVIDQIVRSPYFKTLFCLDPFAAEILQKTHSTSVLPLADPVEPHDIDSTAIARLKQTLQIDPDRRIFLILGQLSGRKGIHKLRHAIEQLPPTVANQICLILAGPIDSVEQDSIEASVKAIQATSTQLILQNTYIKGDLVQAYYEIADVILAVYQRHVGMSSILVHAIAAQKPLIASNYGLLGALVKRYELGAAIDSSSPDAIATALETAVNQPEAIAMNFEKAETFLQQNLVDRFVDAIFGDLCRVH